MKYNFKLRFPKKEIKFWASRYEYKNEAVMCNKIAPRIQRQKYLTKDDFNFICEWKSPRIRSQALKIKRETIVDANDLIQLNESV